MTDGGTDFGAAEEEEEEEESDLTEEQKVRIAHQTNTVCGIDL